MSVVWQLCMVLGLSGRVPAGISEQGREVRQKPVGGAAARADDPHSLSDIFFSPVARLIAVEVESPGCSSAGQIPLFMCMGGFGVPKVPPCSHRRKPSWSATGRHRRVRTPRRARPRAGMTAATKLLH